MSTRERKQLTFLIALLVILGLTLFLAPRVNRLPTASVVQTTQAAPESTPPPVVSDARIRLDLINKGENRDAGRENLFQYRVAPPPPVIRPAGGERDPFAVPPEPTNVTIAPTGPPPPPPITLKYQGFARNDAGGQITAFLIDDNGHYNVKAGEVLMGRYRIIGVTDASVDLQDLQNNRRQTLPLLR
jgi:hypothetical protein